MKESYEEQLATDFGPDPYAGGGDTPGVASVRGSAGRVSNSDINLSVSRPCSDRGKATPATPLWQGVARHGGVLDPAHAWTFQAREPGDPAGLLAAPGAISPATGSGRPNAVGGRKA